MTKYPLPLEDHLCFALYGAHQAMNAVYGPLLEPLGLTYPQYLVLIALWQKDDQTVGQLGTKLGLASNTLTPLLKRMEAAGHLDRSRSLVDERQVQITLSSAGRALETRANHIPGCILSATGLDMAGLNDLHQTIRKLRDSLVQQPS